MAALRKLPRPAFLALHGYLVRRIHFSYDYVLPGLIVMPLTPASARFSNFSVPHHILQVFRDIPKLDRQSSPCIVLKFHIHPTDRYGVDPVSVPTFKLNVVRVKFAYADRESR